ncbi:MutS-related protein [Pseudobacter ginsenosidimutans]|uniref:MutS-like protein n=1 Tax=Pseudobacter ginsenosidimutans TaxID=661488 RepID=A0A4Q7N4J0_9BACT|nr:DNA mismatch repair protein [Pseudobacter ginsenosidimutans]QEC44452.1 DNA mismatch repair protein [Pseudobacter ginsenosidimutans]RZS75924.1 MutS-like protein [Pseudobacter ginsenosidimutans]
MYLQTDEQTIEDLRIFGKRDSQGLFDLYNYSHTRGAEAVLKEMFTKPLCDQQEINRRSDIIKSFAGMNMRFPFEGALFDMAEKYLLAADEQKKQGTQHSVLSEKEISNGVTALITLVQQIKTFIDTKEVIAMKSWSKEREAIASLLLDPAFEPVLREQQKGKLSYAAITAYDLLFRHRERGKIEQLLAQIYQLDVYLSVAKVARERNFVFPKALEKGKSILRLKGVYHPELAKPVSNDFSMDASNNVVFLTGANMAGKSTFLRSVSTAVYVAHIGFPVAASEMEFSVLDGIYTTINLPDNLGIGASHFYAEVLRVKKVASELQANKSLFIIFDEMFRGTNVKDAHEATVEITIAFAAKKNSMFIISSHIVEAGERLKQVPSIGFQFLPTRMNGNVPEYTYTLERGITADRHGMIIIRNEGILETLKNGRKRAVQRIVGVPQSLASGE